MAPRERLGPSVLLPPIPQAVWGGLAVVNFACGGMGTGLVVGIMATALLTPIPDRAVRAAEVIGLLLAGVGLAAVGAEAGRPLRGINVFRHLRRSWMSREALAATGFGLLMVLDVVMPGPWLRGFGAAAAFAFMLSQGFILFAARGVPAWVTWEVPLLFVTSGMTKGLGIVLVVLAAQGETTALSAAMGMSVGAILLDLLVWSRYSRPRAATPVKQEALARLRTGWAAWGVLGLGHVLPLLALVATLGAGESLPGTIARMLMVMAGLCAVAGGAILKWAVVRRAGLLHPVGLNVPPSIGRAVGGGRPAMVAGGRPGRTVGPSGG